MNWILIGIGGSIGAITRHFISITLIKYNKSLILAILFVNAIGSFLLGYLISYHLINESESFYIFITGGFLGAFTTFSTFSYEILELINNKQTKKAFLFIILHILIIFITGFLGFFANR